MDVLVVRKEIHAFIDQADQRFIDLVYSMVRNEKERKSEDIFERYHEEDLVARAKASMEDIKAGRTTSLKSFKKEIDRWKENRSTT